MKRLLIAGTFRARCLGQVLAADAPMPGTSWLPPVYGCADRQLTDLYIGVDGGGAFCDSNWIDRSNAPRAISSAVELFGGTVKANYQTGRWVFDVEGSWDWTNLSGATFHASCAVGGCQTKPVVRANAMGVLKPAKLSVAFLEKVGFLGDGR